jgi:hypothetical protein
LCAPRSRSDPPTTRTAPLRFQPHRTYTGSYQTLADGRLLVSAYYTDFQRSDISAIDPATGATQLLGEKGTVLVVGQRRLLANLHVLDTYGDLTAIDLADGHATELAAEFTYDAFVRTDGYRPASVRRARRVPVPRAVRLALRRHLGDGAAVIASLALLAATLVADGGSGDVAPRRPTAARTTARPMARKVARPTAVSEMAGPGGRAATRGAVVGRVLAKGTRQPVAGAALTSDVSDVGASDAHGDFAVDVPCGPRRLTIQAPGFERVTTIVDPCASAAAPLTVRLSPAEAGRGFETIVRSKPVQPQVRVEEEELTQTPGTLGDPFRVIESLPGVATVAWPAPVYAVRGSNPGNTGFFLDGVRVPALFHFALGPSVIHPYLFDSLEFFPGGYPARYGRYVAGIVAADTRAPATDRAHASVDVRLFDAGALVSAPLPGQGSVVVAGRYSYTAGLVSLLNQDVKIEYWDYQLRADRRVGPFQLTLLAFGSNDVLAPRGLTSSRTYRFARSISAFTA